MSSACVATGQRPYFVFRPCWQPLSPEGGGNGRVDEGSSSVVLFGQERGCTARRHLSRARSTGGAVIAGRAFEPGRSHAQRSRRVDCRQMGGLGEMRHAVSRLRTHKGIDVVLLGIGMSVQDCGRRWVAPCWLLTYSIYLGTWASPSRAPRPPQSSGPSGTADVNGNGMIGGCSRIAAQAGAAADTDPVRKAAEAGIGCAGKLGKAAREPVIVPGLFSFCLVSRGARVNAVRRPPDDGAKDT